VALVVVWGIAVTGILLKALMPDIRTRLSVTLQMVMGWSALVWAPWIWRELGPGAFALIVLGGACYVIGTVIYATGRPRLFPRAFSHHELFHVLVIAGSSFHFFAILHYALPATV
jgi:hemolysin III